MSHRQIPLRAAAILAATAGALAPVADLLAQRRKRRPANNDDDDDDVDDLMRRRLRRRRNAEDDDDNDNDNDELVIALARARRRKAQRQEADDDVEDAAANPSNRQSIVADLGIRETVQERIDRVLGGGGDGGSDDEPNITVSQDGDSLIALTRDIELASDSEGIEVETGGISYTSGAGGGVLDDFDS